jgi:alkanesulfonate monooxygenase SsuD/methylene tetrahydromethanopterin reductase-like flavin-dependent oxidoreductase (luciferase family)
MTYPLRLGVVIPGDYQPGSDPRIALEESIELFRFAEDLGYDLATHRVRHFERALTGIYPFLGAVARETRRIRLGTATVGIANENPVRLAEDTATADLLSNGRIELGVGGGHGGKLFPAAFATAYEQELTPPDQPRTDNVLRRFLRALEGEQLAPFSLAGRTALPTTVITRLQFAEPEEGLRVHPYVGDLRWRIWYGTGSHSSTVRAGELGLGVQLPPFARTEANTPLQGKPGPHQVAEINTYIEAWTRGARPAGQPECGRIAVSRTLISYETPQQKERFEHLAGSKGAVEQHGGFFGPPDYVAEQLAQDPAIVRAREYNETTLLMLVPFHFGLENTKQYLALFAQRIAPQLGWRPTVTDPQPV